MGGAWAHVAPLEVGGLLLRSPLPAQLTWLMRQVANSFGSAQMSSLSDRKVISLPFTCCVSLNSDR